MKNLITIKPVEIEDSVKVETNSPYTKRRYIVDNKIINVLKKFNTKKKGTISNEDISLIKPEFDGELPKYEEKVTIKGVFEKLGILNGKIGSHPEYKKYIVSPGELKKAFDSLNLEQQAEHMEDLLRSLSNIIEEKNDEITKLKLENEDLKRQNQALTVVNNALIEGSNVEIEQNKTR